MNRRLLLATTLAALALPASAASAADYCVAPATGCDPDKTFSADGTGLQAALAAAKAATGADRVLLGAGTYTAPTTAGFAHAGGSNNAIELAGAGRDATTLTAPPATAKVLEVSGGTTSSLHDLSVEIPANAPYSGYGIQSTGDVRDVRIIASPSQGTAYNGLHSYGGVLERVEIDLPAGQATGLLLTGSLPMTVRDVVVTSREGARVQSIGNPTIERSRFHVLGQDGINALGTQVKVRDVLIDHDGNGGSALQAEARWTKNGTIVADGVTLIGGNAGNALRATNESQTTHNASVELRSSIVRGFQRLVDADQDGTGAVAVTTAFSDYDDSPARVLQTGTATVTATGHSFVADPGFVAADDFRLAPGSPLIDAGDPVAPAAGRTDLGGVARSRDGDGDCTARRDIGAFEYVTRTPTVKASAIGARAGEPATFTAEGCDPDGDPLTYSWAFDDGGTAQGATAEHAFAAPGTHTAQLTVSDGVEETAPVTVEVEITAGAAASPGDAPASGDNASGPAQPVDTTAPVEPAVVVQPPVVAPADRAAPRIAKLRAVHRLGRVRVRFTLDEAAKVVVRVGGTRVTRTVRAGTASLSLRARGTKVSLVATDAAGNVAKAARAIRAAAA